jgi:hypothetical protein
VDDWLNNMLLGALSVVVCVYPLVAFCILYENKHQLDDGKVKEKFGGLFDGLKVYNQE